MKMSGSQNDRCDSPATLNISRVVGNFHKGFIFTFFRVKSHPQKSKLLTSTFLLSTCKANELHFNLTWNYLYSHQQKHVSECAFDGYRSRYPGNRSAT